jgi:hypothetical protein
MLPGMGRRMDWWILLPPSVALVLFAAGNDHFGFPPPGWLDAFVYIGYFWHYPEHLAIFENYYKASRLPWILPGFVVFRALGEIAGSYVLHWVTLSGSGVAMYLLLRDSLKDRAVAAVVGVAWVCSTTGHGPGGWGYHALAGTTYYVLTCWLIVRTASTSSWRAGALAGATMACAIHTYPFYAPLAPIVLWLYFAARPRAGRDGWGRVAIDVGWMSAGALAITALLGLINAATGGPWLFFMAQFRTTLSLTQPGSNAWWFETASWLPTAKYLVVPVLSLFAAAGVPLLRPTDDVQRLQRAFALQSWAVLAIFAYFYLVHHFGVLNYDYMSLALYCHAFPALAAMLSGGNVREGAWTRAAILAGAVVVILGSLLLGMPTSLSILAQHVAAVRPDMPTIIPPIVLGVFGLLAGFALPKRLAVIVFAGWFSVVNPWTTASPSAYGTGNPGIHREMLRLFRDMDEYTTRLDPTLGAIEYWFTRETIDSPQGRMDLAGLFDSYVSTRAWYGNLLANQSPGVPIEQLTPKHLLNVTCLGVLSSVAQHEAVRAHLLGRFEGTGPSLRVVGEQQFHSENLALALTVLRVQQSDAVSEASADASRPPCKP